MPGLTTTPPQTLVYLPNLSPRYLLYPSDPPKFLNPTRSWLCGSEISLLLWAPRVRSPVFRRRGRGRGTQLRASRKESPFEVLGVSSSASVDQIKRAYRKLALKYHPDVNKKANAQENFMRIKHAYNTLLNSESKRKHDGRSSSDFSYSGTQQNSQSRREEEEEEFYGFGDFFKDLQDEYRNWESNASSQEKPKSLWEELAGIGEDLVEFLEKELNITDLEDTANYDPSSRKDDAFNDSTANQSGSSNASRMGDSIKDDLNEVEAALARMRKELVFCFNEQLLLLLDLGYMPAKLYSSVHLAKEPVRIESAVTNRVGVIFWKCLVQQLKPEFSHYQLRIHFHFLWENVQLQRFLPLRR